MVAAAIFVMLMDDVLEARIVSGGTSAARFLKMACLSGRDSDTAYSLVNQRIGGQNHGREAYLNDHVHVLKACKPLFDRNYGDPVTGLLSLFGFDFSLYALL